MSPGHSELMTEMRMSCHTEARTTTRHDGFMDGSRWPKALITMGFIALCVHVPATSTMRQVRAFEGECIKLTCSNTSIIRVTNGTLFWIFNSTSSASITIYQEWTNELWNWEGGFNEHAKISDQNGKLTIQHISVNDSGLYTCSLRQQQKMDVKWDVLIHRLPSPVIVKPTSLTLENKLREFTCEVTVPRDVLRDDIRLTWNLETVPEINTLAKQHHQAIANDEVRASTIMKARLNRSSNGKDLDCIASFTTNNGISKAVSRRVALNITYTYNTRVDINLNPVEEGGTVALKCINTSDANPDIKQEYRWFLNGDALDSRIATDVLMLDSVSSNHAGHYSCQIKSPAGWTRDQHAIAGIVSLAPERRRRHLSWSIIATMIAFTILVILLGITLGVYLLCRRLRVDNEEHGQDDGYEIPTSEEETAQEHVYKEIPSADAVVNAGYCSMTSQAPMSFSNHVTRIENHPDVAAGFQNNDTYENERDDAAAMPSNARRPKNMQLKNNVTYENMAVEAAPGQSYPRRQDNMPLKE